MSDREKLQAIEERVVRIVSDVNGYLTAAEADELWRLRETVGESWDAINRRWRPLDA